MISALHLRLNNHELAVHVGIKSVVPSSPPDQNDLLWSVQFVEVVWLSYRWTQNARCVAAWPQEHQCSSHWSHSTGKGGDRALGLPLWGEVGGEGGGRVGGCGGGGGSSHTSDLKIGTPVASLPGTWRYRVSAGVAWRCVSILWLGEVEILIWNFCISVAARKLVWVSLRYTSMLLGHEVSNKQQEPSLGTGTQPLSHRGCLCWCYRLYTAVYKRVWDVLYTAVNKTCLWRTVHSC